jgi:hypothetical protein
MFKFFESRKLIAIPLCMITTIVWTLYVVLRHTTFVVLKCKLLKCNSSRKACNGSPYDAKLYQKTLPYLQNPSWSGPPLLLWFHLLPMVPTLQFLLLYPNLVALLCFGFYSLSLVCLPYFLHRLFKCYQIPLYSLIHTPLVYSTYPMFCLFVL